MLGFPMLIPHYLPDSDHFYLDLASCVGNNDLTQRPVSPGQPKTNGGNVCAWSTDGDQAWYSEDDNPDGVVYGFTTADPFILPGGEVASNGNSFSGAYLYVSMQYSEDGMKQFILDEGVGALVFQLAAPFDNSSRTLINSKPTMLGYAAVITHDGLTIYILTGTKIITRWDLSVSWDVSTAVNSGNSVQLSVANNFGIAISVDEEHIYTGSTTGHVYEFVMSVAQDLDSIPVDGLGEAIPEFSLSTVGIGITTIRDIAVSWDMRHLLISGPRNVSQTYVSAYSYTDTSP